MKLLTQVLGGGAVAILVAAGSLTATATPASAHSIATRCDAYGCSYIVCNYTGDHCRRFDGGLPFRDRYYGHRYRSYGRPYYHGGWYGGDDGWYRARGWHYDCDSDVDRCLVYRSRY